MREIRQPNDDYSNLYTPYREPIATVAQGESVTIHTIDAFGGAITGRETMPSKTPRKFKNPQTGPVYIEGAEPGDTLAVRIENIEPTRDWAVSATIPFFGGLTSTPLTAMLQDQLEERVWLYRRTDRGTWAHEERWEIPWAPFFGTIGTAPLEEAISSMTPGDHGGNMDVPDVTIGHTVYLPVQHQGALFYVGDCHAAQGQGELCGVALELAAKGTFSFEVIKGKTPLLWPRIESVDAIMAVGSARPMEDAARIAYAEVIRWMAEDYGWDKLDAYQLLTQAGGCYVGNMVDTVYSMVASCPKRYLSAA
jgi:acetamidase/formamidase